MHRTIRSLGALALSAVMVAGAPTPPAPVAAATGGPSVNAPRITLARGRTLSASAIPLLIKWSAATVGDAPLAGYEMQRRVDGRSWVAIRLRSALARSVTIRVRPWTVLEMRLRAIDSAGQTSSWAVAAPAWLSVAQEAADAITSTGAWQQISDRRSFGGARAMTTDPAASATFEFTGRDIAWVALRGPGRGRVDVFIDGRHVAFVNLAASTEQQRRVVFRTGWKLAGSHSIELRSADPDAPSWIELDAFVVLSDAASATMVGAGDIASCGYATDNATAALAAEITGIVFTAGDNVYPDGSAANFENCYEPAWGVLRERTRPVVGNHEYYNNPGAAGYYDYFGGTAGPAGQGWYSYDAGTWRIYALNSECAPQSDCGIAQRAWLAADLAAEPHRCTAAIWHRPALSTGPHGNSTRTDGVLQLLYDAGAELMISGHDHGYQRFTPIAPDRTADLLTGIRQFVVGTGGAALYGFASESPLLEVRDNTSHGVLRLDLQPGGYAWQFVPIAGDGFTDSGATDCH